MRDVGIVAIIPARGGSQRIPMKNLYPLLGKPMIEYPLRVLKNIDSIREIVVSTDHDEIADLALGLGASVPFRRPDNLASNETPTLPVVQHAIRAIELPKEALVVCVYPTAIALTEKILEDAISTWKNSEEREALLFSTVSCSTTAFQAMVHSPSNPACLEFMFPEYSNLRTQDLPAAFVDAGQFYVATASTWLSRCGIWDGANIGFEISREEGWDIDTMGDLKIAEALLASRMS